MGSPAFYRHCREGGLHITKKETDAMRDAWISTFKEMELHTKPTPVRASNAFKRQMGYLDEDELELPEDGNDRQLYVAKCINGFIRNNASANAACNAQSN